MVIARREKKKNPSPNRVLFSNFPINVAAKYFSLDILKLLNMVKSAAKLSILAVMVPKFSRSGKSNITFPIGAH